MDRCRPIVRSICVVALIAGLAASGFAQEAAPVATAMPDDPAVAMVLRGNPTTPAEWVRAARTLANLGRADLARGFLGRVNGAGLDDGQLIELAEKYGAATFHSLATRPDMQPEAAQLAAAITAATNRSMQDPAKIAARIDRLRSDDAEVRARASAELVQGRAVAVPQLVSVLADPARTDEHDAVRAVFVAMGPEAVGPMVALLEADDAQTAAQAIAVLTQLGTKQSAIYLFRPYCDPASDPAIRELAGLALDRLLGARPTQAEAARLLADQAKSLFDRQRPLDADLDGRVQLWHWDRDNKTCILADVPAEVAGCMMAARLARDANTLAGDDPAVRRMCLATMLEAAAYEAGLDRPLPEGPGTAWSEAAEQGVSMIEDVLVEAMAADHAPAATAAAQILGRIGTTDGLLMQGAQMAPLVRAMRHADRRLRAAAADAILRLNPTGPYPGCSILPETLAYFTASTGTRRAIVAGPSVAASRRMVGLLSVKGYIVDTAVTGRELLRLAAGSPDYELVLIDAGIDGSSIELLVQQMRQDFRTATIPVGLVARDGFLPRARQVASRDPLALAFSRPHDDDALADEVERLNALAPLAAVDVAERQRQAAWAMDCLVALSETDDAPYDLGRVEAAALAAVYTPGLEAKAVALLAGYGTPEAQRTLADVASRWTLPIESRHAAAVAFRQNTEANGILLTSGQILQQYDRYNESKDLDRPTQQILGLILDCIEAPSRSASANAGG